MNAMDREVEISIQLYTIVYIIIYAVYLQIYLQIVRNRNVLDSTKLLYFATQSPIQVNEFRDSTYMLPD